MSVLSSHWLECDMEGSIMTLVFLSSPTEYPAYDFILLRICSAGHKGSASVIRS